MDKLHDIFGKRHKIFTRADPQCEPPDPANTVTERLNNLLKNGGDGYILSLCPNKTYLIQAPIAFAHPNQEISTVGYPTGSERAILHVAGPVMNGEGHTTAVDGVCSTCSGVKLRNIQIDGTRQDGSPVKGGGNIEMGGNNSGQLIEYVRSYDPRGWTCLHIAEGPLACNNVTVQNNDIGPCGKDNFQEWADGLSISCRNSIVRNNMIQGPTDGGIVLFGAPGTQVYNNTIWVVNQTLLGGINMVDYDPWNGDYTGTVVYDNTILGGFATDISPGSQQGSNVRNAIIKIGIAIGPRTWFGAKYESKYNRNAVVRNNRLSGAFSYGIAVTSVENFVIQSNVLFDNTSFISARGPKCSDDDTVPAPAPFVVDNNTVKNVSLQSDFQSISDGDSLTCVLPPNGGAFWPFGLNPSNSSAPFVQSPSGGPNNSSNSDSTPTAPTPTSISASSVNKSNNAATALGVVFGFFAVAAFAYFIRRWAVSRRDNAQLFDSTKKRRYTTQL